MKLREGSPVVNSSGVVIGTALPTSAPVIRLRTVADAEALFGRGAAVIGARGGVAEHLASVPPLRGVVVEASTPQPDGTHLVRVEVGARPIDLAAENAALRDALAASGELLAEAHTEIERLRGAK